MHKSIWLASAGLFALAAPGFAQSPGTIADGDAAAGAAAAVEEQAREPLPIDTSDILVTATRRNEALSDVPLAVSAVTAETLENSGASDIRGLNQLSASLLVSSSSTEAAGGVARIRGIGTVGDNAGLESSVAVFVDGVYRARNGVALTELGQVERIEVLRGPQGTLFGRNTSAGLISIITARPRFKTAVNGELTLGNYAMRRLELGATGPVSSSLAARFDTVYTRRDGFVRDTISGRDVNNRDRLLARGQLLYQPDNELAVRLIADYAYRNEECCTGPYLPTFDTIATGGGGTTRGPSTIAALERALGATINDDTFERDVSITPGRSYRADVRDWGGSLEIVRDLGAAELTAISAYRENQYVRGQDADFNDLDIIHRADDGSAGNHFRTFSQEVRAQGSILGERLDWLVGGYFANEKLRLTDNLSYGADYDLFAAAVVRTRSPALAAFPGYDLLNPFAAGFLQGQIAANPTLAALPLATRQALAGAIAAQVQNTPLANGLVHDQFNHKSRNFALFTHNIVKLTERLSATIGLRYTIERKALAADLSSSTACSAYLANIERLRSFAASPGLGALNPAAAALATALANQVLAPIQVLPCAFNSISGSFDGGRKKERKWSGTAVLGYRPLDRLLTYASYSKGYKAGGFNLDRAGLTAGAVDLNRLQFEPELVDAYELGGKYNGRGIDINLALFRQDIKNFQLNTFDGIRFVVENINSCSDSLGGADTDAASTLIACSGKRRAGVRSQGIELEGFFRPLANLSGSLGMTVADVKYRRNLIGASGNAIPPALFQLPGRRISNSSELALTGSLGWRPAIGGGGMRALIYADARHMSKFNSGSDLDLEKMQKGFTLVNARLGLHGPDRRWGVELWAQNLCDEEYRQVAFDAPLQGSGTTRGVEQGFYPRATQLYGAFLGEPRTYGLTLRAGF